MERLKLCFLQLGLLIQLTVASSQINDGVEIVVKVNEDVPNHLCTRFFNNLESLFGSASALLEHETSVAVTRVSVQLPASLASAPGCLPASASLAPVWAPASVTRAEVSLGPRDPVFGSSAFSVQEAGCGLQGRRVTLPGDSLVQADNVTQQTVLSLSAALVSHLYGVFPTHGFSGDPAFPLSFSRAEVTLDNTDCRQQGELFCSPHSYPASAPTKQNLLCDNTSPLDIVTSHVTARGGVHVTQPEQTRDIRYVSHVATRYILVLDRSDNMNKNGRWNNVHNALFGFITQLSVGDELAIVTFSGAARTNLEPTPVTRDNKEGLHGRVPGRATSHNASCVSCGLRLGLDLVSEDPGVMTVVLLVRGEGDDREETGDLEKKLEMRNVPVYGLVFGQEFVSLERRFFVISDGTDQQTKISDVFLAISNDVTNDNDGYAKFYENKLRTDGGGNIEGKFSVEESLRTDLKVIITTHSKEDIEKFELVSPSGQSHRFPFVERGSVYFQFSAESEPGIWSFSITRPASTQLTLSSYARVTGESSVRLRTWTSAETTQSMGSVAEPVIIYAELSSGAVPVSGAELEASVLCPDGGLVTVRLVDTGTGYPDITAADGIYSGYFMSYSDKAGLYSVTVTAQDSTASARVPALSYVMAEDCCGSVYPAVTTIPSPPFTRIITGASFYMSQGAQFFIHNGSPRMRDTFAPVRVTDLAVSDKINSSLSVSLSWTSPGDDFDQGTAVLYSLKCSTDRESLLQSFENITNEIVASNLPVPNLAGALEAATIELEAGNVEYFCGLVTEDEAGNQSPLSNLVSVFVRQEPEVSDPEAGEAGGWADAGLFKAGSDGGLIEGIDNMLIYIITGGGIIIVIILIFVIICITHKPSREKKSSKTPMITEISAPTLIHSSSALHGILKPADSSHLSVLPPSANEYMEYGQKMGDRERPGPQDLSWAILPSYSNVAFKKSSETIVDSGFYRAGEAVDNVYEFYHPGAEYAIYQQVNKEKKFEDISDNGTATTDCEISDTHSDKILRHFQASDPSKMVNSSPGTDFHSLIVTSEDFKKSVSELEREHGPVSLPHYPNFEDFAERRRRRESFV